MTHNTKICQLSFGANSANLNNLFNVKQIITGHSLIADTISISYEGKVINLDVHHAGGHSEALFIEGGKQFRISKDGDKYPL